jgi:hypothetical protein
MAKLVIGLVLVAVTAGAGATFYRWRSQSKKAPDLNFTTTSPDQSYVVTVKGQSGPPDMPIVQLNMTGHEVKADARMQGRVIFDGLLIYSGDGYDEGFTSLYPNHRWVANSILEFGQEVNFGQQQQSEIYVVNQTRDTIPYLRVRAGKYYLFLLFDLRPNSVNKLLVHLEWWEQILGAEGRLGDGEGLSYRDVSFSAKDSNTTSAHYCVVITGGDIRIGSSEFEGKRLDRTVVPKANCAF